MDIFGALILKAGIISLSLNKIRRKNNNPIDTTVQVYNQNGELPVLKESTCMDKTWPPFLF